jgi:cytoskeletal protein CcmA (bactofilin family)
MWTKETNSNVPASSPSSSGLQESKFPGVPTAAGTRVNASIAPPVARPLACLGATIKVKGEIHCGEDLQIDGEVEGPISIPGHRLTIGRTAHLKSEITAAEAIVYGKVSGNFHARDRVEIKKDGELIGDIITSRISIEDGAYFKGHIEIKRAKSPAQAGQTTEEVPVGATAN